MSTRTVRDVFNQGDLNKLGSAALVQALGDTLNLSVQSIVAPVVAGVVVLPDSSKAMGVPMAFDRTNGVYLHGAPPETVAGAGQITTTPTGDLSVDPACLEVEALLVVTEGTVVTETVQVVAGVATLLSGKHGKQLLSASVVTGLAPGLKTVSPRAAVPAAGFAALSADGASVNFNAADVVNGTATLKYIATPNQSAVQRLNAPASF